jgi:uncharacterized membrane protein
MNGAHWHLIVNHFPIILPVVGAIVMSVGLILKSDIIKRTAFVIFIFSAFATIAAMSTGESAENVIENIAEIDKNYIESHEEKAEIFALLSYILGSVSLLGIWANFKTKKISTIITIATLLLSIVVLFFAKETGTTGGEIRHTEIRNSNAVSTNEN